MRTANWLCRAGLLGAFAITLWVTAASRADEPSPPKPKSAAPSPDAQIRDALPALRRRVRVATDLINDVSDLPKYWLDMKLTAVPKALDEQLQLGGAGALVTHVGDDGPAEKAGVRLHDVVVAVGQTPIQKLSDISAEINKAGPQEVTLKVIRAGKPIELAITPQERFKVHRIEETDEVLQFPLLGDGDMDVAKLEETLRKYLKDVGMDVRLQFIQPGRLVPRADIVQTETTDVFPDDLTIHVSKTSKEPALIEVKQGDNSWSVTEDTLDELPEEVRQHVTNLLGRGPVKFAVRLPGGKSFDVPLPRKFEPVDPEKAETAARAARQRAGEIRERIEDRLGRRLDEMSREMNRMRERIEDLRNSLRESENRQKDKHEAGTDA